LSPRAVRLYDGTMDTEKQPGKNGGRRPFPARLPFFYGWVILAVGTLGIFMSIPGQTMGVSVFTDDLIRVLGLSRARLSLAYMIGTILSALILTPMGRQLDRHGARRIGTGVIFLFGGVLVGLSFVDRISGFLGSILPGAAGWIAFPVMILGFFLIRFLGQGVLTLLSRNMVMKWFDRYRGMANAFMGVAVSFAFSLAPRVLNGQVLRYRWDGAWRNMGIFLATAGVLFFWLFSRDNPEECGLVPDGPIHLKRKREESSTTPSREYTLPEARKTLPFWVMGLTLAMNALFTTAMTFHVVSIFAEAGFSRIQAVGIFLPASIISVVFNFAASWLSDFIRYRYILIVQIASQLLTMFFLARLAPGFSYIMVILGYGVMGGLFNVTNSIVWPRYYRNLNSITGMVMGMIVAGSAVGPWLFSLLRDRTGSYGAASLLCFAVSLILLVLAFFVRRPGSAAGSPERS